MHDIILVDDDDIIQSSQCWSFRSFMMVTKELRGLPSKNTLCRSNLVYFYADTLKFTEEAGGTLITIKPNTGMEELLFFCCI